MRQIAPKPSAIALHSDVDAVRPPMPAGLPDRRARASRRGSQLAASARTAHRGFGGPASCSRICGPRIGRPALWSPKPNRTDHAFLIADQMQYRALDDQPGRRQFAAQQRAEAETRRHLGKGGERLAVRARHANASSRRSSCRVVAVDAEAHPRYRHLEPAAGSVERFLDIGRQPDRARSGLASSATCRTATTRISTAASDPTISGNGAPRRIRMLAEPGGAGTNRRQSAVRSSPPASARVASPS